VLLMPSYQEAQKRLTQRPHTLSEDEFNLVYKWQEDLTAFDDKIDNSLLSAEETAIKLNAMF
jgi:hypothetical protein